MTDTPKRRGRPPNRLPFMTDEEFKRQSEKAPHTWEYEQVVYNEPPEPRHLNRYGALGWELITVYTDAPPMHDATFYAVFKREITS